MRTALCLVVCMPVVLCGGASSSSAAQRGVVGPNADKKKMVQAMLAVGNLFFKTMEQENKERSSGSMLWAEDTRDTPVNPIIKHSNSMYMVWCPKASSVHGPFGAYRYAKDLMLVGEMCYRGSLAEKNASLWQALFEKMQTQLEVQRTFKDTEGRDCYVLSRVQRLDVPCSVFSDLQSDDSGDDSSGEQESAGLSSSVVKKDQPEGWFGFIGRFVASFMGGGTSCKSQLSLQQRARLAAWCRLREEIKRDAGDQYILLSSSESGDEEGYD